VGVLINVATDFGTQHTRDATAAVVALGSFALAVAGANVLWAVLGGFVVGAIVWREPDPVVGISTEPMGTGEALDDIDWQFSWRRLLGASVPAVIVIAVAMVAAFASGSLAAVTADMSKIGAVAFGNGMVIMPVLQQDALAHHWLTVSQFSAGVGFGQVTPGPFLSTASFVGFAAAGWWGGILAGVAIYAPSVAMTMIVAEVYPLLRRLRFVKGAIKGVMAAFTGLLAYMVLVLARPVLPVSAAIILAAAAFVAVRTLKWSTIVVFAGGLIVWGVYLAAGGAV
jgi:chromate transporter